MLTMDDDGYFVAWLPFKEDSEISEAICCLNRLAERIRSQMSLDTKCELEGVEIKVKRPPDWLPRGTAENPGTVTIRFRVKWVRPEETEDA